MPSYGLNSGVQVHQGFGGQQRNSSRVMAPPGGACSGVFCNDVSMIQMQSSPAPQRRVLSGAQRKPQYADSTNTTSMVAPQPTPPLGTNHSGQYNNVFQNDLGMAMGHSHAIQQQHQPRAQPNDHYSNVFQNDVKLVDANGSSGRPPRQSQTNGYENRNPNIMMNDMQMQQHNQSKAAGPAAPGGGRADEWLSNGQGRTASPAPVRRVVGPRAGSAGANRNGQTHVAMGGLMQISANVASVPVQPQLAGPSAFELREQERQAFLAERAARLEISKANLARQQQNPMGRAVLTGESVIGLLAKAAHPEEEPACHHQQTHTASASNQTFGGTLKGGRPKAVVAKGAPRCAQPKTKPAPAPKAVAPLKHASHLGGKAPEYYEARKAASAKSRSTASARSKKVAAAKAGVPQKLRINAGRTSSRVLAPPGGKCSISFGN